MTLPLSHKIIVIDDMYDDVKDFLSVLSKNGLSYIYFTGKIDHLPPEPFASVRVVFSDIDLVGARDNKNKISTLLGVLKTIISPQNGPYIIVFWTKHSELIDEIKTQWNEKGVPPLKYLCIEKSSCKDANGNFSMELIEEKIQEQTEEFQAFNFYLNWENTLVQTADAFIKKFHELVPRDRNWSHNIYHLLYRMFMADSGENGKTFSTAEQFATACRLFNKSFNNELDCNTASIPSPDELPSSLVGSASPNEIVSDINTCLWIHKIKPSSVVPGEVVLVEANADLKKSIVSSLFDDVGIKSEDVDLVRMVITPSCDIAQSKLLKNDKGGCLHRVVYAIILESKYVPRRANGLFYYLFGPFSWKKKQFCMHFHFGTVGVEYIAEERETPCFVIKQEIVFDIQSKIANHMNRLGNSQLKLK